MNIEDFAKRKRMLEQRLVELRAAVGGQPPRTDPCGVYMAYVVQGATKMQKVPADGDLVRAMFSAEIQRVERNIYEAAEMITGWEMEISQKVKD